MKEMIKEMKNDFEPVVDRTEPNLPNTEASVRYYSVRFGEIQKYRTESLLLILSIFKGSFKPFFERKITIFKISTFFLNQKSHWNLVTTNIWKMLYKNAIKFGKQEYTLIFIYYEIRFGIIRFGSVRIPKLRYSVFRYFTRFGRSLLLNEGAMLIHII